jgi:hypothetical protein
VNISKSIHNLTTKASACFTLRRVLFLVAVGLILSSNTLRAMIADVISSTGHCYDAKTNAAGTTTPALAQSPTIGYCSPENRPVARVRMIATVGETCPEAPVVNDAETGKHTLL